jgi:hypothetical protein
LGFLDCHVVFGEKGGQAPGRVFLLPGPKLFKGPFSAVFRQAEDVWADGKKESNPLSAEPWLRHRFSVQHSFVATAMGGAVRISSVLFRLRRKFLAASEIICYALVRPARLRFVIVSCERNAGDYALRCLESVYQQDYDRTLIRHLFVDDASEDGTHEKVQDWLQAHPDHSVEYLHRDSRQGGTANTREGFSSAEKGTVIIELNGDDWLPDSKVLDFYSRVYADQSVWMTYNSCRVKNGPPWELARPCSRQTIENNAFRDMPDWSASHLHTFRSELFSHLDDDVFIDPMTGEYWECADDQAIYLGMLELAGKHSKHLNRMTCIYNFWEESHSYSDNEKSVATANRIRQLKRYQPLQEL